MGNIRHCDASHCPRLHDAGFAPSGTCCYFRLRIYEVCCLISLHLLSPSFSGRLRISWNFQCFESLIDPRLTAKYSPDLPHAHHASFFFLWELVTLHSTDTILLFRVFDLDITWSLFWPSPLVRLRIGRSILGATPRKPLMLDSNFHPRTYTRANPQPAG